MKKREIEKNICDIKRILYKVLKNQQYEATLDLVSLCACILYDTNLYYMDPELESMLQQTAHALLPADTCADGVACANLDTVLFYDGFGFDNRGLAQIYLKAIGSGKKLCYVTYKERADEIPVIQNIIHSLGGNIYFLEEGTKISQINQLNRILQESHAAHFFLYTYPTDVVAPTLLYGYGGFLNRYQINLTDHAFWLGAGCFDRCIEFREYGASISAEYRCVSPDKIVLLPFYPVINTDCSFQGYPFEVGSDSKVVFSGGSLYKTLGKDNKYYEIVRYLLSKYEQAIFWYAGSGDDTMMRQLMNKFPGRVFLTPERDDLFQVLQHCYFYLSTYPICGGLMYQYAACAGKIPLTLRSSDDNDGYLLNQESLGVEFDSQESLEQEIDHLMEDEDYVIGKGKAMKDCVISSERFQRDLCQIIEHGSTSFPINYKHIDTEEFRQIYLDNITPGKLVEYYARKTTAPIMVKHFPLQFFLGAWSKVRKKRNKLIVR